MQENRKDPRYRTLGRARIRGLLEGDVLLKNMSITGCCLECTFHPEIKSNEVYEVEIDPEDAVHVGKFSLEAECRWIRNGDHFCEIGFQIVSSPTGRHFQRYVDYLTYHSDSV
ncbi:MAG: PilZ domain-containing protein [Treponema sp.]|jgi:hypothetical protein|nr:PilZ domain-containing protein [Treponema sp.]